MTADRGASQIFILHFRLVTNLRSGKRTGISHRGSFLVIAFAAQIVADFSKRSQSSKTVCQTSSIITLLPTWIAGFEHENRHTDDLFYRPRKD